MAHYEPPHQDLRCLQVQLFSSLVLKELRHMSAPSCLPDMLFAKENAFMRFPFLLSSMKKPFKMGSALQRICPLGTNSFHKSYLTPIEMDGWMICNFRSFLTVFQSYQDAVWMRMKGCVQWNSVYGQEDFTSTEDRPQSARSVGQRLTH